MISSLDKYIILYNTGIIQMKLIIMGSKMNGEESLNFYNPMFLK